MIVLIGSHKGGVGKSTMFIHLMMCLQKMSGKRVAALECDDQNSIKFWQEDRQEKGIRPGIDYFECYTNIVETARKLDKKYDIVLMDAPGRKSAEFRKCLACADVFLSFVDPSAQVEINTLGEMISDVQEAQASYNPDLKAMLVMNRCSTHPSATDAADFRALMATENIDVMPLARQRIYRRNAYYRAYNAGLSVHEFNDRNGNQARGEVELLLKEAGMM